MIGHIKGILAGTALALAATTAQATVVSGTIEEGGPSNDYNNLPADHSFADFSSDTNGPLLTAAGDFKIWGSVTHTSSTTYKDGWIMDFGAGAYSLVLDVQNQLSTPLDFLLSLQSDGGTRSIFGGTSNTPVTGFFGVAGNGDAATNGEASVLISNAVGTFSGRWKISIDPIAGIYNPVETMRWQLTGTDMTPIPLPASALLLLGGLGGLAALRRKGRAA